MTQMLFIITIHFYQLSRPLVTVRSFASAAPAVAVNGVIDFRLADIGEGINNTLVHAGGLISGLFCLNYGLVGLFTRLFNSITSCSALFKSVAFRCFCRNSIT